METLETNDIESQVMGMSGEDIVLSPAAKRVIRYSFECKNQERLNLWSSLEQAESNCEDRSPVLVFKRNRSKIYVAIEFDHFIELIDEKLKEI
jgi:IS1 family transposase